MQILSFPDDVAIGGLEARAERLAAEAEAAAAEAEALIRSIVRGEPFSPPRPRSARTAGSSPPAN